MTLIEVLTFMIVLSILTALIGYAYFTYVTRAQITDVNNTLDQLKVSVLHSIAEKKSCLTDSPVSGVIGTATSSGTMVVKSAIQTDIAPTGCQLAYTFTSNASPELKEKTVTFVLMNNGQLYLNLDKTTVDRDHFKRFPLYTTAVSPSIPIYPDSHPANPKEFTLPNLTPIVENNNTQ